MLNAQYAMELGPKRSFTVFPVNPGWLRTDMGGQHANLKPGIGACQVVKIMQEVMAADNGSFRQILSRDGRFAIERIFHGDLFQSLGFAITMCPEFSKSEMRESRQLY